LKIGVKSHGKGVARLKLSQLISYEQVTDWVYHLITERLLSASSVNVAVSAVRFLYAVTLGRVTVWSFGSIQPVLGKLSRFGNPPHSRRSASNPGINSFEPPMARDGSVPLIDTFGIIWPSFSGIKPRHFWYIQGDLFRCVIELPQTRF
jgi:hypothetical protein